MHAFFIKYADGMIDNTSIWIFLFLRTLSVSMAFLNQFFAKKEVHPHGASSHDSVSSAVSWHLWCHVTCNLVVPVKCDA